MQCLKLSMMIIQSEREDLSGLIIDFKKYTAKKIIHSIDTGPESRKEWMLAQFRKATASHGRNKEYQFWRYSNHPEEAITQKFIWSKLDYIHLNPVRAGIVNKASHYSHSSASNYVIGDGAISVTLAENPVIDVHNDNVFWKSITW